VLHPVTRLGSRWLGRPQLPQKRHELCGGLGAVADLILGRWA